MNICLFTALFFMGVQQQVPYKPSDEFDLKLQYEFRPREFHENSIPNPDGTWRHTQKASSMLPYLEIRLKVLKLRPGEERLRIIDNRGVTVFGRKARVGEEALINMGFTDDLKDRVSPHEYTAAFFNSDGRETSRIVITVGEDGTFLVNSEKRGKF